MTSSGGAAPVLNQVEIAPETPLFLERQVSDVHLVPGTEENDPNKYSIAQPDDEKKYITDPSRIGGSPEFANIERAGLDKHETPQDTFFMQSSEAHSHSDMVERYDPIKRSEARMEDIGRKDSFKSPDKKYDFKLPTS